MTYADSVNHTFRSVLLALCWCGSRELMEECVQWSVVLGSNRNHNGIKRESSRNQPRSYWIIWNRKIRAWFSGIDSKLWFTLPWGFHRVNQCVVVIGCVCVCVCGEYDFPDVGMPLIFPQPLLGDVSFKHDSIKLTIVLISLNTFRSVTRCVWTPPKMAAELNWSYIVFRGTLFLNANNQFKCIFTVRHIVCGLV